MTAKCTELYPFWQQFHDKNWMSTTENINATKCVFLKILTPSVVFSMPNHNQLSKCIKIRGYLFCFFSIQRESLTYNSPKTWKYLTGYYFWEKGERRNQATHWRATAIWSQQSNNLVTAKSQKKEKGSLHSFYTLIFCNIFVVSSMKMIKLCLYLFFPCTQI